MINRDLIEIFIELAREKNIELGFGLVMDARVVSKVFSADKAVDHRYQFLPLAQENLVFNARPVHKLDQSVNQERHELASSEV